MIKSHSKICIIAKNILKISQKNTVTEDEQYLLKVQYKCSKIEKLFCNNIS